MGYKEAEKMFKKTKSLQEALALGTVYDPMNDNDNITTIDLWNQSKELLSIPHYIGTYIIKDALDRKQQIEIVLHILFDMLKSPNMTNLHSHHNDNEMIDIMNNIWINSNEYIDNMKGYTNEYIDKSLVLSKIRWITLGYQYDWTNRSYKKEKYVPFPIKLAQLCTDLTASINNDTNYNLHPEAAIINFYQNGNIMGGHQDDVESTFDHPVLSISIGCPCIFLLGGFNKEDDPLPILLRSGDVLFMGGPSRLRYHGVPKVFINEAPPPFLQPSSLTLLGDKNIHYSTCSCFLDINNTNDDTNDNINDDNNDDNNDNSNDNNNLDKDDNVLPRKRMKIDNITKSSSSSSSSSSSKYKVCTCGNVPRIEILRALKYLQITRLNLNVRQVF